MDSTVPSAQNAFNELFSVLTDALVAGEDDVVIHTAQMTATITKNTPGQYVLHLRTHYQHPHCYTPSQYFFVVKHTQSVLFHRFNTPQSLDTGEYFLLYTQQLSCTGIVSGSFILHVDHFRYCHEPHDQ